MQQGKKVYFASDFHLGIPSHAKSIAREKIICQWLDDIKNDAEHIYLVGDLFDFWFEYKTVVPKGHIRFLGKLAELRDANIPITCFKGNHDMWQFGYLKDELGIELIDGNIEAEYNNKQFLIGHGDGKGPGDKGYKMLKKLFRSNLCQWLFARLHPNFSIGIANYFSRKSRVAGGEVEQFLGNEEEWLVQYCRRKLQVKEYNYFVFGHRHLPLDIKLSDKSRYINLGDWITHFTYAIFDGENLELKTYNTAANN